MFDIFIFAIALLVIARSSAMLVRSLSVLSRIFQISEYTISFILMGFVTSMPELFIGISSTLNKTPEFSFGNILGANIVNISLIIGLAAVFAKGIEVESKISRRNFWFIFVIALMPILLAFDGSLSRPDGITILLIFSFYFWHTFRKRIYFSREENNLKRNFSLIRKAWRNLVSFLIGILFLLGSSALLVWSGENIAETMKLSNFIFGIIFVSIGTTLPEIIFGIRSSAQNHRSMTIGNTMGSIAFNAGLVVGLVSVISPISIQVNPQFLFTGLFLIVSFLLFNAFIATKNIISKKEGVVLLLTYVTFIVIEYILI